MDCLDRIPLQVFALLLLAMLPAAWFPVGVDEIIAAPGPSGLFSAHVRGWNYDGSALAPISDLSFFAFPQAEASHGSRVFASADLNGNGRDEIVVGGGPDPASGSPVAVFLCDGAAVSQWFTLEAFDSAVSQGATVVAGRF
jgi:hypothetical protein